MTDLMDRFNADMMDIYRRAKAEVRYNATRFCQMLNEHGGIETAKSLLHANTVSEAYTALWERGRLDLTVEALIHDRPEYHPLFTDDELGIARRCLEEYKYPPVIDPLESLIGAFPSEVPDWTSQHDKYLGQTLMEEMRGSNGPR